MRELPARPCRAPTPNRAGRDHQRGRKAVGSEDHAVKVANQPNRSLYIELARINATELTANTFDYDAQMDAALAQLVALYALDARPVEVRP